MALGDGDARDRPVPGALPLRCPAELVVLRHAESVANAAFAAAQAAGVADTDLTGPDSQVALSPRGREQAARVGEWLCGLSSARLPEVVLCSPYRRARQTWDIATGALRRAGCHPDWRMPRVRVDDRLRDRETGVLELLTAAAIRERYAEEFTRRQRVGEFHYRPLGGESLADVSARLTDLMAEVYDRYAGRRVLLMAHDAVVLMLRYVVEDLSLDDLRKIMEAGPVRNASLTRWVGRHDGLLLTDYNEVVG